MASITLDPRLLAPPETSASAETFRAYVERLLEWSAFAKEKGSTVTISRHAQQRLMDDNAYPLASELRNCLQSKGIIEYDLKTLKDFCEGFFRYEPCFQDFVAVKDVYHDKPVFSPNIPEIPSLKNSSMEAEENLATLVVLNHCQCSTSNIGFALQASVGTTQVSGHFELHDIEHTRDDLTSLGVLPKSVAGNVTVCSNLSDYVSSCNWGELFQTSNEDSMRLFIKLAIFGSRISRGIDVDWMDLPRIRIGAEFLSRAQGVGQLKSGLASNILEAIVDAYEGINEKLTHPIRTGAGGGAPQKTSGTFGAWRRDVASDVHLHYWKGAGGIIELSWISHPHDDFHIPQPSGR